MNRLLIAFEGAQAVRRIQEMLTASGLPPRAVCHTGAEVIRAVRYMGGGVIVCGAKFADMTADQLYEDLSGSAFMLVAAKSTQLDLCQNPGISRLSLPFNRQELAAKVEFLCRMDDRMDENSLRLRRKRSSEDENIIAAAKEKLMREMNITEPQAHRLLQRRSMDMRLSLPEAARLMLK